MVWIQFLISAAIVVLAAHKLAEYGDIIAVRTKLGGLFVGTVFLAAATSLPEMLASISAFQAGFPNLAAGNFFGSNMVNMLLLALVDLLYVQVPLMRKIAVNHALTAGLTILLMLIAVLSMVADIDITIGWVGVDSLLIIAAYFVGLRVIQQGTRGAVTAVAPTIQPGPQFPTLRRGVIGFTIAAVVLLLMVPLLVNASTEIAVITGLGTGFIGVALLSVVTSLPELIAALSAMRMNAFDMAVGNLFGSSVFNMLALGVADFLYVDGRFLGAIDPNFVLVGLLGLILTTMALMGTLARVERRILFIELDSAAILIVYLLGMYLLFVRGIGL
ncbi:MAG TPA: sodium:calcium antiporter [Anaerolineae bacterium]|nr:sodium:calcium antiporter [Anaerolineae bacterium]HIP70576.1 sodium:calcium antiporter [Anaerolineae bacterium]